jgi:cytochrome P450
MLAVSACVRARPGYGRSRGLPPGSLGLASSLDAISDPEFYALAARRWGPVFKMSQFHRPVVCVVDLRQGLELLAAARTGLAQPSLPFGRLVPGGYIQFMNDPLHTRYRGILRAALGGGVAGACRSDVESVVRRQLSGMIDRQDERGVDPEPFLDRIAFASLVRVMFGLAVDDERIDRLARLFVDLGTPRAFAERRPGARRATFARLTAAVRAAGEEMLARPDSGMRSALGEILRADPELLHDETLIGNLVLIVQVTRSSVRGLLGWVLKEHCDHPEWARTLGEARGAPGGVEALATNFVNETLRRHQSEYFYRDVVGEIRLGPYRIPKGWLLRVCVRECHDDPAVFPDPGAFDPGRFAARAYGRTEYCPFGDGPHSCLGGGIAVMIARTLVLALAGDVDVRGVSDGPVERAGNRHWSHWQPSRRFRVAVQPREARSG